MDEYTDISQSMDVIETKIVCPKCYFRQTIYGEDSRYFYDMLNADFHQVEAECGCNFKIKWDRKRVRVTK